MTQENKTLLIQDLCARLPYGVKAQMGNVEAEVIGVDVAAEYVTFKNAYNHKINDEHIREAKPYLFPLSSMTEGQKKELIDLFGCDIVTKDALAYITKQYGLYPLSMHYTDCSAIVDWLNAHHFDYRGLIEKGLSLDATGLNIYD